MLIGNSKYLCFILNDYDSLMIVEECSEVYAIVAIVETQFFIKNRHLKDSHIMKNLPKELQQILGDEIMESHFEVIIPISEFCEKAKAIGLQVFKEEMQDIAKKMLVLKGS